MKNISKITLFFLLSGFAASVAWAQTSDPESLQGDGVKANAETVISAPALGFLKEKVNIQN